MPEIYEGYNTEQEVETVANNDTAINAAISARSGDGWLAVSFTVSGSDVIILFTRNVAIVET